VELPALLLITDFLNWRLQWAGGRDVFVLDWLESCYHRTLRGCPAAGASLAGGYSALGNSCILEVKGTDFFPGCVFTSPKAIKESLYFRPVCKSLCRLEISCQSDCVRDQTPISSGIDIKGEKGLVKAHWSWA